MKKLITLIMLSAFALNASAFGFKIPKPPFYKAAKHVFGSSAPKFGAVAVTGGLTPLTFSVYKQWKDDDEEYQNRFRPIVPVVSVPCSRGGAGGVSPC